MTITKINTDFFIIYIFSSAYSQNPLFLILLISKAASSRYFQNCLGALKRGRKRAKENYIRLGQPAYFEEGICANEPSQMGFCQS